MFASFYEENRLDEVKSRETRSGFFFFSFLRDQIQIHGLGFIEVQRNGARKYSTGSFARLFGKSEKFRPKKNLGYKNAC